MFSCGVSDEVEKCYNNDDRSSAQTERTRTPCSQPLPGPGVRGRLTHQRVHLQQIEIHAEITKSARLTL